MTWEHDWPGNMQSWDDDSAVFYERSLGEIVNGADLPSEAPSRRTGALYVASNLPATPVTADDPRRPWTSCARPSSTSRTLGTK